MSNKVSNYHDAFFKGSLQNVRVAHDFFSAHLPAEIQKKLDLSTLRLCNNEFIDKYFQTKFCDVLYSVEIDEAPSYLYLLTEHQSSAERLMPFRVLHYQCQILGQHLKQHKGVKKLPLIYGLVFYHGKTTPYPYSTQLKDCFKDTDFAEKYFLQGFQLIDIGQVSDEEIKQHRLASALEMLQKHAHQRDLLEKFKSMIPVLKGFLAVDLQGQLSYNTHYLIKMLKSTDPDEVLKELDSSFSGELRGEIMSVARGLLDTVKQQGMQQGMQQGGDQKSREIVRRMSELGYSEQVIKEITGSAV